MQVVAIRGAITVEDNKKEDIIKKTEKLLIKILKENRIKVENIISVFFTCTPDLNAEFPAVAARKLGWKDTPLICSAEINVPGSLEKCIRVMMHVHSSSNKKEIKHIYLEAARRLRPDIKHDEDRITIAIDGPAGAGKSTVAKLIAKRLGIIYLDTGAMYRTIALKAIEDGVDTKDITALIQSAQQADIQVVFENGKQVMLLNNREVSGLIRTREVTKGSSDVAVVPEVRKKLVEIQRNIAKNISIVMDGRDIGTHVLPDASFKFYLNASIEERAKRRYNELIQQGKNDMTYDDVIKDISYRDKNDSSRSFAPLMKADNAIEIDTTDLCIEEVVDTILERIEGFYD